jgi:hypothetical protein
MFQHSCMPRGTWDKNNVESERSYNNVKQRVRACISPTNMYLFEVHYKQKLQLSKNCPLRGVNQAERPRDERTDIKKCFKWDECSDLIVI